LSAAVTGFEPTVFVRDQEEHTWQGTQYPQPGAVMPGTALKKTSGGKEDGQGGLGTDR